MKILFDQNLSPKLAKVLQDAFPGSTHVRDVGLREAEDWEIWNYSASHGFAIASRDRDFRQRSLVKGPPPKVIHVALGNCATARVEYLIRHSQKELGESKPTSMLPNWNCCDIRFQPELGNEDLIRF